LSSIPVIAFLNYDGSAIKKEVFELGVKDYLIKTNYTPNEILAKIKQVLVST
jgi:PleD family two-component response regulator